MTAQPEQKDILAAERWQKRLGGHIVIDTRGVVWIVNYTSAGGNRLSAMVVDGHIKVPPKAAGGYASKPDNDNNEPIDPWAEAASPSLPEGVLPATIEAFARSRAEQMGADPGGLALAALVVCAAAAPDNLVLKVKRHESWTESARIWGVVIGDPSTRKSPIIRAASAPLRKIEADLQAEHRDAMRSWSALPKDVKKDTAQPVASRVIAEDASPEKVADILSSNEHGIALIDDELSGWFSRMEKYAGAKGAGADRAFWLKSFGGGPYNVDRIGRGSIWVPNVSVSLLGGIQPDPLRQIADGLSDDGLLQRMFVVMLAPAGDDRDEPAALDEAVYGKLVSDLYGLRNRFSAGWCFRFNDEAQTLRGDLAARHREMERTWADINKRVATHIGKFDGMFARLALLFHLIEHADSDVPPEIDLDTADRAARFLHDWALSHTVALHFNVLGATDVHDAVLDAAGSILTHPSLRAHVTGRDLARHGTRKLRSLRDWEMERVL